MLWAVFSDIHANLPALEAVLRAIEKEKPDRLLCLGDLVGYGPHPREVLSRARSLACPVIGGNHDLAAIGALDASCFNVFARQAVSWTAGMLSDEDRGFLGDLPLTWEEGTIAAVHGTWDEPKEFLYLQTVEHAQALLEAQPRFLGLFGHTHVPLAFLRRQGRTMLTFDEKMSLSDVDRALVNVGSVGQPRDENPHAAFVMYDDSRQTIQIRRVPYDIESVAADIVSRGLPKLLGERLRFGM